MQVNATVSMSEPSSDPGTIVLTWHHSALSIEALEPEPAGHRSHTQHKVLHYNLVIERLRRELFLSNGKTSEAPAAGISLGGLHPEWMRFPDMPLLTRFGNARTIVQGTTLRRPRRKSSRRSSCSMGRTAGTRARAAT